MSERKDGVASQRETSNSLYRDDWWLEHLEEELEPNLREDLELLLKNSQGDRVILESLKRTRQLLKSSDDVPLPESGHFYDSLHAKIMAGVESKIDERDTPTRLPSMSAIAKRSAMMRRSKLAWAQVFGAAGLTMMLAMVSWMTVRGTQNSKTTSDIAAQVGAQVEEAEGAVFERRLAMVSGLKQSGFNDSVLSFEDETDFITEAAAQRLERMPASEAEAVYDTLRN